MTHDLLAPALRGPGPWAHINTGAITHNLRWAKQRVQAATTAGAPVPRLWAVVKADAYGHGMSNATAALHEADGLCVASLDDVMTLRHYGWKKPILLLSIWGLTGSELRDPALGELHFVVDDWMQLETLEKAASLQPASAAESDPGRPRSRLHAWLRAAGRLRSLGFSEDEYRDAFLRLRALMRSGAIAEAGHLHHYAASDDPEALSLERQTFCRTIEGLDGPLCTGNSAALCGVGPGPISTFGHWLRCGLLLYGASAVMPVTGPALGLRPAMSLHARLLNIRPAKAGVTVGYGDSFRVERDTFIGTVGIGYGHGVPRRLWQRGHVLAGRDGRRVPLAGRVAMDCLTVDLGPEPAEQPGDIVTLWGHAPNGALQPVEEVAKACDTIAAELLTGLTHRVPLLAATGSGA